MSPKTLFIVYKILRMSTLSDFYGRDKLEGSKLKSKNV